MVCGSRNVLKNYFSLLGLSSLSAFLLGLCVVLIASFYWLHWKLEARGRYPCRPINVGNLGGRLGGPSSLKTAQDLHPADCLVLSKPADPASVVRRRSGAWRLKHQRQQGNVCLGSLISLPLRAAPSKLFYLLKSIQGNLFQFSENEKTIATKIFCNLFYYTILDLFYY